MIIDDVIPIINKNGKSKFTSARKSNFLEKYYCSGSLKTRKFWTTLMEKAILKLYFKGYNDLPSNASIEIFHLLGWFDSHLRFSLNFFKIPRNHRF